MNKNLKQKVQERITTLSTMGQIPAEEAQLNLDVIYNSILDEILSVVPMDSPRQIVSCLTLRYGSKNKQTSLDNKTDVFNSYIMNSASGSIPLNEQGYVTNEVHFTSSNKIFYGDYQNILPKTINISNKLKDDGNGNIIDDKNTSVGTVDYNLAKFNLTGNMTLPLDVSYKFDIYNIPNKNNSVYLQKESHEVFAEMFKLDLNSARSLYDMRTLDLRKNIETILPQILTQQIDKFVLDKYFRQLSLNTIYNVSWDATVDWKYVDTNYGNVNRKYRDLGALVALEMANFTSRTGIYPNIIICDPLALGVLATSSKFNFLTDENIDYISTPRKVGYFGTAKVFLVQNVSDTANQGRIILTYKGVSDALTSAVYTPYIPVTLRSNVNGMENNMIITDNAYSISGFTFTNLDLISGIFVNNINLPE